MLTCKAFLLPLPLIKINNIIYLASQTKKSLCVAQNIFYKHTLTETPQVFPWRRSKYYIKLRSLLCFGNNNNNNNHNYRLYDSH